MSENKLSEEIVKSLADELEISEDEIRDLLKSEDEDKEEETEEKEEGEEETEEAEEKQKSESQDLSSMSDDDLKKSLSELVSEVNKRHSTSTKEDVVKSDESDIMKSVVSELQKSVGEIKDELQKSLSTSINELNEKVDDIVKAIDVIGENSRGLKGVRFDFIEKSGDSPIEKDGKIYLSSRDRNGISEAMLTTIEKSQDDDFKKSVSADLINYQGSGELSKRAIINLNKGGYYFKEQMK